MSVNLELYRIFYITAKTGSISKAAAELFTSQPAVSQSIKQLESKLGGRLFHRGAKGVRLTKEGEVLLGYVERGYHLMMTAERKFAELKQMAAGHLRIAVCSAVCKYELLEAIVEYHQRYPNIRIDIKDRPSQEIAQLLDLGEIDIGVLNSLSLDENEMSIIKTIQIQDCFVAGQDFKHLSETPVGIRDIAENYPLIMLQKGGMTRAYIEEIFRINEVELTPEIEVSNLDLMVEFAVAGLGVACVAKDYAQKELDDRRLIEIPIKEIIPPRHLAAVTKKRSHISTAAQSFVDILAGRRCLRGDSNGI